MKITLNGDPRANPSAAMPRSLWKKAWRFVFTPFYRHFDTLHLEVAELKSGLQSARMLHDQYQRYFTESRETSRQQALLISAQRQRLEETAARLAALDPAWREKFEAAHRSWEEHIRDSNARMEESAGEITALRLAMEGMTRQAGELVQGLDQLRVETRPRLHQIGMETSRLRKELDRIENPAGGWFNYTEFEDKFRGHEADIIKRQSAYLPLLRKHALVADLGCGRGELLEVLRKAHVEALGVELHPQQAQRCSDKGLRVEPADFMSWLPAQADGAFGAITALQVVEHLHLSEVDRLIREAFRALRPGGLILLETVNPHSPDAMEWFYIDPTHKRPVYPEILELLLASAGFIKRELRFQSLSASAPKGAELNSRTGSDFAIWGIKP